MNKSKSLNHSITQSLNHFRHSSAALIMGLLIVVIVGFFAFTVSKMAMGLTYFSTNAADSGTAETAAQAGFEDALQRYNIAAANVEIAERVNNRLTDRVYRQRVDTPRPAGSVTPNANPNDAISPGVGYYDLRMWNKEPKANLNQNGQVITNQRDSSGFKIDFTPTGSNSKSLSLNAPPAAGPIRIYYDLTVSGGVKFNTLGLVSYTSPSCITTSGKGYFDTVNVSGGGNLIITAMSASTDCSPSGGTGNFYFGIDPPFDGLIDSKRTKVESTGIFGNSKQKISGWISRWTGDVIRESVSLVNSTQEGNVSTQGENLVYNNSFENLIPTPSPQNSFPALWQLPASPVPAGITYVTSGAFDGANAFKYNFPSPTPTATEMSKVLSDWISVDYAKHYEISAYMKNVSGSKNAEVNVNYYTNNGTLQSRSVVQPCGGDPAGCPNWKKYSYLIHPVGDSLNPRWYDTSTRLARIELVYWGVQGEMLIDAIKFQRID